MYLTRCISQHLVLFSAVIPQETQEAGGNVSRVELQNLIATTFESFAKSFEAAVLEHGNEDTVAAIVKAEKRLQVLTNPNLINSALFTFGTTVGKGGWGKIPVQPTSRARRKEGTHKGKAVVQRGRKAKLSARKLSKKRAHNLSANILANVANAKGHSSTMF